MEAIFTKSNLEFLLKWGRWKRGLSCLMKNVACTTSCRTIFSNLLLSKQMFELGMEKVERYFPEFGSMGETG